MSCQRLPVRLVRTMPGFLCQFDATFWLGKRVSLFLTVQLRMNDVGNFGLLLHLESKRSVADVGNW